MKVKKVMPYIVMILISVIVSITFLFCGYVIHNKHVNNLSNINAVIPKEKAEIINSGYNTSSILGTVGRSIPKADTYHKHEKEWYPSFYNPITEGFTNERKLELISESQEIIDSVPSLIEQNKLYKFIAADGQFFSTIPETMPRIKKRMTINWKAPRRQSLEVFAPAGEILTVEIDESLVNKVSLIVGYPFIEDNTDTESGHVALMANNRMPRMYVEFKLTSTVTKIGSPFGGMVVLNGFPSGVDSFDITISGGVDMPNYTLGVSTKEDWQEAIKNESPYIWAITPYMLFVMPKISVKDIADPYDALMFWYKSSSMSFYAIGRQPDSEPVIMVFDSYVPAGGAVAFVPNNFCILPSGWCTGAMDYYTCMYSGNWGNLHEFNHQNQNYAYYAKPWGLGENGEVSNNVFNSLSYILYTDIATNRTDKTMLAGGNWEVVTDPYYCYKKLMDCFKPDKNGNIISSFEKLGTNKVFAYADIIHNFGADKFIHFVRAMYGLEECEGIDFSNNLSPVEGKTDEQQGYLKTADGFCLAMCNFYKTDFTDYLKNIWKVELSSDVIAQIKSKNYSEFFSISNLYSSGIKGVGTGRAYYLDIGINNTLDFEKFTACSTENWKIKSITFSAPELFKKEANSWVYTFNSDNIFDDITFEINFEVVLNGKTYRRTLTGVFKYRTSGIIATTYDYPNTSKRNADVRWEAQEVETKDYPTSVQFVNNFTTSVKNGDNFTHLKAKVVFPFSGNVSFMVYGDDKTMLKIGDQVCYLNEYLASIYTAKEKTTNKLTVNVQANTPIVLDAYCLNGGGQGGMYLKYSVDGQNYLDIPSNYCYNYFLDDSTIVNSLNRDIPIYKNQYNLTKKRLDKFYKNEVEVSRKISNITCLDDSGNEVVPNADTTTINMYDGNRSTYFHTAWKGTITPFPHNYIIEFSEETTFNKISFYFDDRGVRYAFGDYELYYSLDGANYTKIASGRNDKINFSLLFDDNITAKFVKLVVKNNTLGNNYTSIAEVEFYLTSNLKDYNFYTSYDQNLTYIGSWEQVSGQYVNTQANYSLNGKVQFYFTGTNLTLYSHNINATIKIDGKLYELLENNGTYSPSFVINDLKNENHFVEISGEEFYLDAIKTDGQISSARQKYLSKVLSKQQILIISATIFVGLAAILVVPYTMLKRNKKVKSRK